MGRRKSREFTFADKVLRIILRVMFGLLRLVDIRIVALMGRGIGLLTWAALPSRRQIVARNIRIAVDPTLRGKQLNSLVRQNIVRTCENMVCTFKTGLLSDKELNRALILKGKDSFITHAELKACQICCVPHAGNWEMMARLRPLFPAVARFGSLYRRLDNPALEEAVYNIRTSHGCEMFNIKDGLKEVFRLARDGGMLGVLSDQFTQQGIFIPYFGKVTGTTPLPSLIFKRRKENANLYVVTSRSTGLAQWEVDFSRQVSNTDTTMSQAAITMEVNLALEEGLKNGILDGFWMHHRWKPSYNFAPDTCDEYNELIRKYARLPFRIIICVPEQFEEAVLVIPMMRRLQACRPDMQLTVVCPKEQQAFWQTQPYITYVVTTNGTQSPAEQLESDELYKDGPYDFLFMLSSNEKVFNNLKKLMPMYLSGFASNPLARKLRTRFVLPVGTAPLHKSEEYQKLANAHVCKAPILPYADATQGNEEAEGCFIAPFSTLGSADTWEKAKWVELIAKLSGKVRLLAFESDREAAEALSKELGIEAVLVQPETVASVMGSKTTLYAVDGLLPQLAALVACRCHVIMASRLASAYAPLGEGHHVVFNHTPCHPCYRSTCDQTPCCTSRITVDEMLGVTN